MDRIQEIISKKTYSRNDVIALLSANEAAEIETIRDAAEKVLLEQCGSEVYYRGLIEFSNRCARDCYYCGIRKSMQGVERYDLAHDDIIASAKWCAESGYGSLVLQSGERSSEAFVSFVETVVRDIKAATVSEELPQGLGITLCVGEQSRQTYDRFLAAGAHRYLLRIETTNPELFASMHPADQKLQTRIQALRDLRDAGFQVGTGVMIGLPGQTIEHLADDVLFFRDMDVDMIGMGPFIPHPDTPMGQGECLDQETRMRRALLMIAATRLALKDVNIAATTALQTLDPQGREQGLRFGANVIMPQLTPVEYRKQYLLYQDKPCVDENAVQCRGCLQRRITSVDRTIGYNKWGDSRHFNNRLPYYTQ